MSKKISVSTDLSEVKGVWISRGEGDVHFYVNTKSKQAVIGKNKSYKDSQHASEIAVIFGPGEEVSVQFVSDNGGVKFKKIDSEKLAELINQFLVLAADAAE